MSSLISITNPSLVGAVQPATLRAPEIEPGVGCDFDSYLLVPDNSLDQRIAAAKARLVRAEARPPMLLACTCPSFHTPPVGRE